MGWRIRWSWIPKQRRSPELEWDTHCCELVHVLLQCPPCFPRPIHFHGEETEFLEGVAPLFSHLHSELCIYGDIRVSDVWERCKLTNNSKSSHWKTRLTSGHLHHIGHSTGKICTNVKTCGNVNRELVPNVSEEKVLQNYDQDSPGCFTSPCSIGCSFLWISDVLCGSTTKC
uniref:Uncharacterized protein n=1 Tax=Opuntia streptacantha TaxID=393608 RepID=A0A7C9DQ40_OPUST